MKLKAFILTILSLFLFSACKKNKDNNPVQAKTLKEKKYKDGYQIVEPNGCDTKRHDFSSKSASDVKKQLCKALQDDELNGPCAESLREKLFNQKCTGLIWKPKYNSETHVDDNDTEVEVSKNELKVRKVLNNLISKEIKLVDSLSEYDHSFAKKLSEDIQDCGFSYMDTKCLINGTLGSDDYVTRLEENNENLVFLSELGESDDLNKVSMLFQIEINEKEFSSSKLVLYRRTRNIGDDENIKEYLADKGTVVKLMDVTIAKNIFEEARKRSKEAENIRALFHYAKYAMFALENTRYDSSYLVGLEIFKQLKQRIMQLSDVNDLEAVIDVLEVKLTNANESGYVRKKVILLLGKINVDRTTSILINAIKDDLSTVAQLKDKKRNLTDKHLDELIAQVKNDSGSVSRSVIELIATFDSDKATFTIIEELDDNRAFAVLKSRELTSTHVPSLSEKLKNTSAYTRRIAASLLGKIKDKSSLDALNAQLKIETVDFVKEQIIVITL